VKKQEAKGEGLKKQNFKHRISLLFRHLALVAPDLPFYLLNFSFNSVHYRTVGVMKANTLQ
jgi:hypothetical protein